MIRSKIAGFQQINIEVCPCIGGGSNAHWYNLYISSLKYDEIALKKIIPYFFIFPYLLETIIHMSYDHVKQLVEIWLQLHG